MDLTHFRERFPHTTEGVHVNHAGLSPVARDVAEASCAVALGLTRVDTLAEYVAHADRERRLRALIGRMVQAPPAQIGFVRNTSHGLAIAAMAVPRRDGANAVAVSTDYPSCIYPWQARGSVRLVEPREDGRVAEEDLMAACDSDTDVLSVSWVHWLTGQVLDLETLSAFCTRRGILMVVDIVQGLGALRLDLSRVRIDIAAAGCHKWLMTPAGIGLLYVHPETMARLLPVNIGWNSVDRPMDWDRLHFDGLRSTPRRFEEGSPSLLSAAGLLASLEIMESAGFDAIETRVLELAQRGRERLAARGMAVVPGVPRSGIVPFQHPALSNEAVLAALDAAQVTATVRGGYVRFSPHFYMSEADIDRAVDAIPRG